MVQNKLSLPFGPKYENVISPIWSYWLISYHSHLVRSRKKLSLPFSAPYIPYNDSKKWITYDCFYTRFILKKELTSRTETNCHQELTLIGWILSFPESKLLTVTKSSHLICENPETEYNISSRHKLTNPSHVW